MDNHHKIHTLQREYMDQELSKEDRKIIHESWFREDTIDFWRHDRMYETISPLVSFYISRKWLTVGDGRYGLDSYRLNQKYDIDVLPTDISGSMLEKSKQLGIIKEYRVENAEYLSFPDHSYDLVFCKESFHHFPRPLMALYEMVRVAREAVVLIDSNEGITLSPLKALSKQLVNMVINYFTRTGKTAVNNCAFFPGFNHVFEESGNYVYSVSRRELIKVVHAINLKGMAWKGFNDHYIQGCEFEQAVSSNAMFTSVKNRIASKDKKCLSLPLFYDWNLLTIVLFKNDIDIQLRSKMESEGYYFEDIMQNPYVHHSS